MRRLPSNWRKRLEITRTEDDGPDFLTFRLQFKKGQTPRGFHRWVGNITVNRWLCSENGQKCTYIDEAEQDPYFARRGLGTLLYVHALTEFGSLTTYYHRISDAAQGLWKSLARKYRYETDFFEGTLTIFLDERKTQCRALTGV